MYMQQHTRLSPPKQLSLMKKERKKNKLRKIIKTNNGGANFNILVNYILINKYKLTDVLLD